MNDIMLQTIYGIFLKESKGHCRDIEHFTMLSDSRDFISIRNRESKLWIFVASDSTIEIKFTSDSENENPKLVSKDISDVEFYMKKLYEE